MRIDRVFATIEQRKRRRLTLNELSELMGEAPKKGGVRGVSVSASKEGWWQIFSRHVTR